MGNGNGSGGEVLEKFLDAVSKEGGMKKLSRVMWNGTGEEDEEDWKR